MSTHFWLYSIFISWNHKLSFQGVSLILPFPPFFTQHPLSGDCLILPNDKAHIQGAQPITQLAGWIGDRVACLVRQNIELRRCLWKGQETMLIVIPHCPQIMLMLHKPFSQLLWAFISVSTEVIFCIHETVAKKLWGKCVWTLHEKDWEGNIGW